MSLLSDYLNQVQFLLHDQSNQDFTQSELTSAINNARTVVAEDFQCCRATFLSAPNNAPNLAAYNPVSVIPNQELYPLRGANGLNGIVVGANVLAGGSGYSAATVVTFSAGPTGSVLATGVPVIASGVITSINMTAWGTGYQPALPASTDAAVTPPTVTITDSGGGTGANATAVMFNNVFNVIQISYIWGNQRYTLLWRGAMLFQAYMRSQQFFTQRGMVWTINQQGGWVQIQPPPDQPYITEWDTICLPLPLLNPGDVDSQIVPPYDDAVQFYAAHLCLLKLQNFDQAEKMLRLYSARVPKIIIGTGGVRIPNPYNKSFQRRVAR
jgi:hypothetical protein